uniref:Uncharacterized protein n=1 Tax=viral metagenome TaxID=1070528 RepID=A0A6H1ZP42_9ZZZZ
MKIYVNTNVIDHIMIKKLLEIETIAVVDIIVNIDYIRGIVTYGNSSPLICGSCHEHHYPDQPCQPCQEKT